MALPFPLRAVYEDKTAKRVAADHIERLHDILAVLAGRPGPQPPPRMAARRARLAAGHSRFMS
jgi:hypothetical protein